MPPIHKNQLYELFVMKQGVRGDGITLLRSKIVHIPNALPCDRVVVKIVKILKTFCYGKLTRILDSSQQRRTAPCPIAAQCGGCAIQHQKYGYQLQFKERLLDDILNGRNPESLSENAEEIKNIGESFKFPTLPIIAGPSEFSYRNKLQVAIQRQGDDVVLGLYAARSHRVVPMPHCLIQGEGINRVLKGVTQFLNDESVSIYDEDSHTGEIRHLMIREGHLTGELMVAVVSTRYHWHLEEKFAQHCLAIKGVVSVHLNTNGEKTDIILGPDTRCLAGRPYLIDCVLGKTIKVSLESFMQANSLLVAQLYQTIIDAANLTGTENVVDAYCGVGSLSLCLADHSKQVVGIEENKNAIADAKINQSLNKIQNCHFICQKVEHWIDDYEDPIDVLVLDPPRQGCMQTVLETICRKQIKRVVYCSCNPKTFVRDADYLIKKGYVCRSVQPFDLFPQTAHMELVAVFELASDS